MKKIIISYSGDKFDQWRLGQAGGYIGLEKSGKPVFVFRTKSQYENYLALNSQRKIGV
ncbi:hypothetical protein RY280_23515 [Bacillus paralicheniformis]|uniref:hypothetical protein n=1 Tax=Bacillus paralicheniformis TaxID=1648923 RepID=UPI003A8A4E55